MEATDGDKTNNNHRLKSRRVDSSLQLQAVRVGSEGSLEANWAGVNKVIQRALVLVCVRGRIS